MVVCKYFQEGRCRFGENCKFEHQRSDVQRNLFGGSSGANTWSNKTTTQSVSQTPAQDLVNQLPREMDAWEKSKMWPFSCVAMEGETEAIPGFFDTSAEELRFEAYQALKSGNIQSHVDKVNMLNVEFQDKRKQLRSMQPDIRQKLIAMLEESRKKKAQSHQPSMLGSSTSSNPFGSKQSTSGLFGQPSQSAVKPGLFGQSASTAGSTGLFGKPAFNPTTSATNSIFGGSGNSTSSVFGNSGNTSASVFGNTAVSSTVFGGQTPSATANPFASTGSTTPGQSLFGGGASTPVNNSQFGSSGTQSLFGKPAATQSSSTVFGSPNPTTTSVFGNPKPGLLGAAPVPAASTFGAAQTQSPGLLGVAPSPFGSQKPGLLGAAPGQPSLFGNPPVPTSSAQAQTMQGLFGKPVDPSSQSQSLFGKPTQSQPGVFGSSQNQGLLQDSGTKDGLYTPLADLTEIEKAEFSAAEFTLGRVPLRPPARELINV